MACIFIYHGNKIYLNLNLKPKMLCTIPFVSHKFFDYYITALINIIQSLISDV